MVNCSWHYFSRDSLAHLVFTDIGLIPRHLRHWATFIGGIFASLIRSKKFCRTRRCCFGVVRCCLDDCLDSSGLSIRRGPNVVQSATDLCFIGSHFADASPTIDEQHPVSRRFSIRACRGHPAPQSRRSDRAHTGPNPSKTLSISGMDFIGVWLSSRLPSCGVHLEF